MASVKRSQAPALTLAAPPAWLRYLLLCAVPMALAPLLLTSQWGQTGLTVALGYLSAGVCVWRFRTGRGVPAAWLWIGAGLALNASGSLWESVATQVFNTKATPSGADALYLALYPCVTVGLLRIVRARSPGLGPAKLIDAGTLTVGLGLLCWVFLIRPSAASASGSDFARAVQIAYPVGDLMLLAILARIMAAEGWRTPTVRLLLLGLLGFLTADSAWAVVNDNGWSVSNVGQTLFAEPSVLGYVLLAAAALHTSTKELEDPAREDGERMSRLLLASLMLASLVAPAILAGQAVVGRVTDGVAIAVCSAQLTVLVIARMSYLLRHMQRQSARLRELALEDALTGLPNRRALQTYLAHALQRARREARPLSLAIMDVDHFKRFNDEYGHPAGDQLLKSAAATWGRQVRSTDMLARVGGEEFVLVLPDADIDQASALLEKLRARMPLGQTFSAGVAQWDGQALPDELIKWADDAMYQAKRAGRDRIERATGSHPAVPQPAGIAARRAAEATP
jgi:diguanylate cyclase (GGDEF)-like protein